MGMRSSLLERKLTSRMITCDQERYWPIESGRARMTEGRAKEWAPVAADVCLIYCI